MTLWTEGDIVDVRLPRGLRSWRWLPGVVLDDDGGLIVVAYHDPHFGQWECFTVARKEVRPRKEEDPT